jgi:predicted heme/steroid binding protein
MPAEAEEAGREDPSAPTAGPRRFSRSEFSSFDGTVPGRPILVACRGRVYDVSHSEIWAQGRHFWSRAGRDLTGQLDVAPHGEEVLARAPCVGFLDTEPEG